MTTHKKVKKISLRIKFAGASLLLAFILCTTTTFLSYTSYKNSMTEKYTSQIQSLAKTAAGMIDPNRVQEYMQSGVIDDAYLQMQRNLQIISHTNNLEYLYAYVPAPDHINVFVQGTLENEEGHFPLGTSLGDEYYGVEDILTANLLFSDPNSPKVLITSSSSFGYLITAFEVLRNDAGTPVLVVGADMSMNTINAVLQDYLRLIVLVTLAIVTIFTAIYLYYLERTAVQPLQILVDSAVDFVDANREAQGNVMIPLSLAVHTGDEIEEIAIAFNKMTEDIVSYIGDLTSATSERERIQTELKVATLIQEGMLPKDFVYPGRDEFNLFASMKPAKDVGGDFYDFFFVNENKFCIIIGDVSGKGVPAALFMAMSKATIKDLVLRNLSPDEVLTQANNSLCKNNEQGMFVTVFLGIIDLPTGEMQWSDAGHCLPVLWHKNGTAEFVKGKKGFICAGMEDYQYKLNTMQMEKDDILYVYTDGVSEAINVKQELYSDQRVLNFVNASKVRSTEQLCKDVVSDVARHAGEEPQFDDITMLAFELRK